MARFRMRVLLNCSSLVAGGALQAAVSFIIQAAKVGRRDVLDWRFVLSPQVRDELEKSGVALDQSATRVLERSPAKSNAARRALRGLESEWQPSVVFTFFGPAYVRFRAPHLCGVADGWVTHSNRLAFKTVGSPVRIFLIVLRLCYKAYWFRKADRWVVEASNAKAGLVRRLLISPGSVAVVPNSCGQQYISDQRPSSIPPLGKVKILCLSSYYAHKNLEIIPEIVTEIEKCDPSLDFEFVLTLGSGCDGLAGILSEAASAGVSDRIRNIGPVAVAEGPSLYRQCHISFLPSLLETFSANYPEAMAMACPIVTTNLPFARDVCGSAALYYEPEDAKSAARTIVKLVNDPETWSQLVAEGKRVLGTLPSPQDKYDQYVLCLRSLSR